ncbi:hypothetical protein [Candidatus Absconditicoccus praedator]|uniref:hypothetical protein n=1 Tax=Candidatus Absconditicoccus praedator TaxID=2735562 RepID=UPI001E5C2BD9|nr:hypothetical protein [Candidatus Absconditicoccus praedator]UFX83475.1 hypothetical protein HLG78_05085 [Candidatus Absconditicoccus praedator]
MDYKVFGCRLNKYYANQWLNYFYEQNIYDRNYFLLVSCQVTDKAKTKWIKEAKSQIKKGKIVYLAGCGSIDKGNIIDEKKLLDQFPELKDYFYNIRLLPESPKGNFDTIKGYEKSIYTRKNILIQNGCDTNCTFCITAKKDEKVEIEIKKR